jgi:hypothetical protein
LKEDLELRNVEYDSYNVFFIRQKGD